MDEPRSTAPAPWEWDTLESSGALVCDYILCLHEDHVAVPFFRLRSPTATPLCLLLPLKQWQCAASTDDFNDDDDGAFLCISDWVLV